MRKTHPRNTCLHDKDTEIIQIAKTAAPDSQSRGVGSFLVAGSCKLAGLPSDMTCLYAR